VPNFIFDNISFVYREEGMGIPVIFLHGLGGDVNQPFSHFPRIKGYRLISIDFRGHGKTRYFGDESKFGFAVFAQDVIALMDYLQIDSAVVGGISTGAGVALHIALQYPKRVSKLILSRIAWLDKPQDEKVQAVFQKIAENVRDHGAAEGKIKFKNSALFCEFDEMSPPVASSFLQQFDYPHIEETYAKLIKIPHDAPNYDREEWREITVPTLILTNKIDPLHPYHYGKMVSEFIDNSIFREIPPKAVSNELHMEMSKKYFSEFLKNNS
jgi:pimeloyl-ACP methyl ester carboxylesterase